MLTRLRLPVVLALQQHEPPRGTNIMGRRDKNAEIETTDVVEENFYAVEEARF